MISVISYAMLEVGFKKWGSKKNDSAPVANSVRFMGYVGLSTMVTLWPCFFILNYTHVETFEWPPLGNVSPSLPLSLSLSL